MDIFLPIVIFVLVFIILSICGWCCKRKREGTIYGPFATNVTITSHPNVASPVVVPPYPIDPNHPTPYQPPPVGFTGHNVYPTHNAYPVGGLNSGIAYIPPPHHPIGAPPIHPEYTVHPPSYSEAVAQGPTEAFTKEAYVKQSPYNPHY